MRITALAAVVFAAALLPSQASAAHVCGTNPRGDYFLSLRTGPGTGYPEIARLVEGTEFEILRNHGRWLYVATSNQVGYVSASYVCR
jgi:uncharacterized protein YraI